MNMPQAGEVREETAEEPDRLPGYAECHFCTVENKRRSWGCVRCIGRLNLRERFQRKAEEPVRRRVAAFLSLILPGLGHWYRSGAGTGLFFFLLTATGIAYLTFVEGEMTSGRWSLIGVLVLLYLAAAFDASRGPGTKNPPCQDACPAGLPCSLYVGLARDGRNREALELVDTLCPFPGTVGRVCHHPCEQNCRRAEEGEAIAICALKRFLSDEASELTAGFFNGERAPDGAFNKRVAVIGGGPSGLSCALYLRLLGSAVTIFESRPELGGMPGAVIPDYRLPAWVFREEIERVVNTGVEVQTGRELGKDFSLEELAREGYDAVYLALGAQRSVRLPHCGTAEEGFLDGLQFLRDAKAGRAERLQGNVLVIGGGNVAIDVAKTAVRMGAANVRKVFLETRETMPAHTWECEEALEEGVKLVPASATVSFEKSGGRVVRANCRRVERIDFDKNGRISPVLAEGTDFTLDADWVITAVGTGPDYSLFGQRPELKLLRGSRRAGRLAPSAAPGIPVFAGGDYFSGPASVIDAIAAGHQSALAIYRALGGCALFRLPVWNRIRPILYPGYVDSEEKAKRRHPVKVDPEVRCESFCEVCEAYDVQSASDEAARCLRCAWPMKPVKLSRQSRVSHVEPPKSDEPEGKSFV